MTLRNRNVEIELTASYVYIRVGRLEFYAGRDAGPRLAPPGGASMASSS